MVLSAIALSAGIDEIPVDGGVFYHCAVAADIIPDVLVGCVTYPLVGSHVAVAVKAVPFSVDLLPAVGCESAVRSPVLPATVAALPSGGGGGGIGVPVVVDSAVAAGPVSGAAAFLFAAALFAAGAVSGIVRYII